MLIETITPRISETDALGHINNNVLSVWFDEARVPIYKIFTPDLSREKWRLIMARTEINFKDQIFLGAAVGIESNITKIGTSSFDVMQTAYQKGKVCATCQVTWIHFDFLQQKTTPITTDTRSLLEDI